jgi:glycosyltransferase involved in cell wall biosynthesis
MDIEIVGKFFDNHSLTIINRNLALQLNNIGAKVYITPLDSFDPQYGVSKETIKDLKTLAAKELPRAGADIQIRHSYPPIWQWPPAEKTKVVYIQPWEYPKLPFEWQYKWETFADHVIVPSNYIRDIAVRGGMWPDGITVVPNGYNEKVFNKAAKPLTKYGINPEKFNFVYVGNPQWRKGLDLLINAWHKCFKSYDNARLIIKDSPQIYGQNNILNELIKMQYKTECAKVVYIDEPFTDEEMAGLFAASKVVIHPYRAEGFGMHIQEAVACGCLPIVPDKGPHDDFIPQNVGLRIQTNQKLVDITSGQIFAQKPGDAFTMMNSHTFMNEPDGQSLEKVLQFIYHSHDKKEHFSKLDNLKMSNTWENVAKSYLKVLEDVHARKVPAVRHRH